MNEVEISGIVSHIPVERELANGNRTLSWRIKVPRDESGNDSIPCTVNLEITSKALANKIESLEVSQTVHISGVLRSRFWQGAGGSSSRLEVEVISLKKISKSQLI
jgi:single-strand DNA-binding protein